MLQDRQEVMRNKRREGASIAAGGAERGKKRAELPAGKPMISKGRQQENEAKPED